MSGFAVRRAFDQARAVTLRDLGVVRGWGEGRAFPVPVVRGRRVLPVRAALEWAFGAECALLDFDDAGGRVVGRDCIARLMDRKALGCAVDGGGRSGSHPDADVIAACVADLPARLGGRSMAVRVAELARAGLCPDAMVGARVACVPRLGWRHANQHRREARTECLGTIEVRVRGKRVVQDVMWCPLTWTPTLAQIGAARREHAAWRAALADIAARLPGYGGLSSLTVTGALPLAVPALPVPRVAQDVPPATPWTAGA